MIYWCKKCKTPIFDKGLHNCSCDGKIIKISESSICNPVFKQEKKLLEKIMDCDLWDEVIWYLGASKYLINEKIVKVPYREWYRQKKHLTIEYLKQYSKANRKEINKLLWDKLPDSLSDDQKKHKVHNLLTALKNKNIIEKDGENQRKANWILKD